MKVTRNFGDLGWFRQRILASVLARRRISGFGSDCGCDAITVIPTTPTRFSPLSRSDICFHHLFVRLYQTFPFPLRPFSRCYASYPCMLRSSHIGSVVIVDTVSGRCSNSNLSSSATYQYRIFPRRCPIRLESTMSSQRRDHSLDSCPRHRVLLQHHPKNDYCSTSAQQLQG